MINFVLKIVLSILTVLVDGIIAMLSLLLAILFWEERWIAVPNFIFTEMLWDKNRTITQN